MLFSTMKATSRKIDTSHLTKVGKSAEEMTQECSNALPILEEMIKRKAHELESHKTIFIVEDDDKDIQQMRKVFHDNGIQYQYASDVGRAFQDMSMLNPRLLVLDSGVPDFERLVDEFGYKTVIFTGAPQAVTKEVKAKVLGIFSKHKMMDLIKYLARISCAGPEQEGIGA